MKINNVIYDMTKKVNDGSFVIEQADGTKIIIVASDPRWTAANNFYNTIKNISPADRPHAINDGTVIVPDFTVTIDATAEVKPATPIDSKKVLKDSLGKLINFFTEFSFTPSFRFVNTLSRISTKNVTAAKKYINNYFTLMDSSYINEIREKVKSAEFSGILNGIKDYGAPASTVNNRLRIYYGAAGTGKTTLAQSEADNRCVVCNASMLPADLMEDFVFTDGHPDFNPSLLYECMEKGLPIVLDEINLLPFDSLRFLQGITDGKTQITYKNREITIKDGFQIIGTMNLTLGGATYGLPEPLVDRCSEIREFDLTADQLMSAIVGM